MSSLNYTTYVSQISNLLVIGSTDPNFQIMLPGMIDYAEQRIFRELDLLYTQTTDTSAASSGVRTYTLPTNVGTFVTVSGINVLTPVGTTSSNGTRHQLTPVSREFMDVAWPAGSAGITDVPQYFSMASNTQVIFGPAPDAGYTVEVVGTQRPQSLSSANSSTILTQYLPDLFVAASMVFGSGYQRDFSAQGDNPQQGISWEGQYKTLFQSAATETARAKFQAEGWTARQPYQVTTPRQV